MINNQPRVTVGVPVYNGERYLGQALDSILAQTFNDFEVIICDNASTDGTAEVCQSYVKQDRRIRYSCNAINLGAARNQNRVVELARGRYFKWAHHDDYCAPEFLEHCVAVLDRDPTVVLCYPRTVLVDAAGAPISPYEDGLNLSGPSPAGRYRQFHQRYRHGGVKCNSLMGVIRTEVLRQTRLIGAYPSSDKNMLAELVLRGKFQEIPEYLLFRREHPESSNQAHRQYQDLIRWYDPSNHDRGSMVRWRWLSEYLSSVSRVHLSWPDKLRCYEQVVRWSWWNHRALAKDLLTTTLLRHSR
ncbi:glycosyltransferase family 2 protein [Anthocerotibacter panamensis]|uniref:glycosyltransferase family 2 protein n=1 Tax=Anthocerotibacter panamensis TaxID=2857077 RepID=UPI001C40242A|nr:glycosyltransferase family 2 protein [Anthocerotibacter panamensis]